MLVQSFAEPRLPTIQDVYELLGSDLVDQCITKPNVSTNGQIASCSTKIKSIASLEAAQSGDISYIAHAKLAFKLPQSKASYLIVDASLLPWVEREIEKPDGRLLGALVTRKPYLCYAKLTQWWVKHILDADKSYEEGVSNIHTSAVVDPSAEIDESAVIGPLCVVEAGAVVGPHTVLKSRVTLGARCKVGANCILHSGVVVGSDGFGFANQVGNGYNPGGAWEKIEQLGRVVIGNEVEIGANVCIDRGALSDTIIEDGVKLDNLIHIAHGVRLGRNTAVAAGAVFAGGVQVGENCTFGGAARLKGHIKIADNVHISADTSVIGDVTEEGQYTGMFPMLTHKEWMKNAALIKQLALLRKRVQELEKKIGE